MLQLKIKISQKVGQISSGLNYVSAEMRGTTTESQQDFQLRIEIF